MIVCLCRRVSDRDIRRQVACGVGSFEALQAETGVGSQCGRCVDCAHEVFELAMVAQADQPPSARGAIRLRPLPA